MPIRCAKILYVSRFTCLLSGNPRFKFSKIEKVFQCFNCFFAHSVPFSLVEVCTSAVTKGSLP